MSQVYHTYENQVSLKVFTMKYFAILSLAGLLCMSACKDADKEKQMQSLEKRVAALERHEGGVTQPLATSEAAQVPVAPTGEEAVIRFESTDYDFGTVQEGEIVEHTYTFTNTGKSPLVINKATASCGCTVPQWPKEPIPVNGTGEIKVRFDSNNRTDLQTKYITITANTNPGTTQLKLSGIVQGNKDKDS